MEIEHVDVLVVGAGISGIGAGYRLQTECPGKSFVILEGRHEIGGTWSLFQYPGIRSDSDMYTLGYPFRPWRGRQSIADGAEILQYVKDTAAEYGIDRKIRFDHKVTHASWSSEHARWTVDVERGPDAEPVQFTCSFLYFCSGYYSYDDPYQPEFPGKERFQGQVVHPQLWPDHLDHAGKRVIVIGSGATAITLVPAMAKDAGHVTMLQRSPSYVASLPQVDPVAQLLKKLPGRVGDSLIRWKNVAMTSFFFQLCRRRPNLAKKFLTTGAARLLPPGFDMAHFTPSYDPWDQRMCLVPDGDLFTALKRGDAEIVTDHIDTFTEHGIRLRSGKELEADIIVTATGLTLQAIGGASLDLDGEPVNAADHVAYKGHMLSGLPNVAMCVGYTNASWTLRADLTNRAVCRLLNHMDAHGYATATPTLDGEIEERPILDLTSGYIQRGLGIMPKQGSKSPWMVRQNYVLDLLESKLGKVDESMTFTRRGGGRVPASPAAEGEREDAALVD